MEAKSEQNLTEEKPAQFDQLMAFLDADTYEEKLEQGGCIRLYATWHKGVDRAGYYMIVRGEDKSDRKFLYMDDTGKATDLGEAPVESAEMQQVMDLELARYAN